MQKAYWQGGNKNEFVVCLGVKIIQLFGVIHSRGVMNLCLKLKQEIIL